MVLTNNIVVLILRFEIAIAHIQTIYLIAPNSLLLFKELKVDYEPYRKKQKEDDTIECQLVSKLISSDDVQEPIRNGQFALNHFGIVGSIPELFGLASKVNLDVSSHIVSLITDSDCIFQFIVLLMKEEFSVIAFPALLKLFGKELHSRLDLHP
jgi:hypothetical protein